LRIDVIRRVACIQPYHINAPIRGYGQRAKDVPLVWVNGIIIDPNRRTERLAVVGTPGKHHIRTVTRTELLHACHDINIIVRRTAGMVHRHVRLPTKPHLVYAALNEIATQIDVCDAVESWRDSRVLRIRRANAVEWRASSGEKKVAIRVHIHCSRIRGVGNVNRRLPCYAAIGRTIELTGITREEASPKLI